MVAACSSGTKATKAGATGNAVAAATADTQGPAIGTRVAENSKADNDMNKTSSRAPLLTVVAQALSPKADALKWLGQAQTAGTSFRVPVEINVSPLGLAGGSLGFADDRIAIKLDDSALGIGLADRAHDWCGDAPTCAMWVWATWQNGTLVVSKAEQAIQQADRATATHIHVAS